MARKRSFIAGMTDYTGVALDDIESHLSDWEKETRTAQRTIRELAERIRSDETKYDQPDRVLEYVSYFCDLFDRYIAEFDWVRRELALGVRKSHVEALRQLFESSEIERRKCRWFKDEFIERGLRDESVRFVLDEIYSETTSVLDDYLDLSNLLGRLEAFVDRPGSPKALKLEPQMWGVGINLPVLWRRLNQWWSSRRSR